MEAFSSAQRIEDAQNRLIRSLNEQAASLEKMAGSLSDQNGVAFGGIDFSMAPYPVEERSIGAAMERLGVPAVGLHGSLAATAILTNAIDRAVFKRTGFSGIMLPVLEDFNAGCTGCKRCP